MSKPGLSQAIREKGGEGSRGKDSTKKKKQRVEKGGPRPVVVNCFL